MPTLEQKSDRHYRCAVEATLDVVGGKWKGVIVYHLLQGTKRFGELRRLIPDVTQRMLTLHLRELEGDGMVHREVYREVPPRVEYTLTPFGQSLAPVLQIIQAWGEEYKGTIEAIKRGSAENHPND
jgi:DNA-binding HxlR family transcriptional regulator